MVASAFAIFADLLSGRDVAGILFVVALVVRRQALAGRYARGAERWGAANASRGIEASRQGVRIGPRR